MTPGRKLSSYIASEASPEQMAKQWRNVEACLGRRARRRRWRPVTLALAGATAALLVAAVAYGPAPDRSWATRRAPMSVALADGSQVELRPESQVSVVRQAKSEMRLRVVRGGARFDVHPDRRRRFQVDVGEVDVVVTGTAFSVELGGQPGGARVVVERGEVEVHPSGQARVLARLHANEAWPSPLAPVVAPAPPQAPPAPVPPAAALAPTEALSPRAMPVGDEPKVTPPVPSAASATGVVERRAAPSDARSLLEQANAARRSGDLAQAAVWLEALSTRFPRDPRAALATFELGRLRMDALADLPGAIRALNQSIALAPAGLFREDAEACLAAAHARMGDRARCEQARRAYLGRYPAGTRAAEVAALKCGNP